jgi:LysM repeat protein
MTPNRFRRLPVIAIILCSVFPAWGEQFLLYAPHPVSPDQKITSQDGILVQEIEIRKGDTLYGLSRKFTGRGMYFPQILLFNSIKNPNLIYPGKSIKVPVTKSEIDRSERTNSLSIDDSRKTGVSAEKAAPGKTVPESAAQPSAPDVAAPASRTDLSLKELTSANSGKSALKRHKRKSETRRKKNRLHGVSASSLSPSPPVAPTGTLPSQTGTAAAQRLFEDAVKAYRKNDCRAALDLLDRYLASNSDSTQAADANLYKAECYMKMSGQ